MSAAQMIHNQTGEKFDEAVDVVVRTATWQPAVRKCVGGGLSTTPTSRPDIDECEESKREQSVAYLWVWLASNTG
mgnify:FL=1